MDETAPHPADALAVIRRSGTGDPGLAEALEYLLVSDRDARVGNTHHAVVRLLPGGHVVDVLPLPDLRETLRLLSGPLACLDTETTGLNPRLGDCVTSVAVLGGTVAGGAFEPADGGYHVKVNPGRASSAEALAVHGMGEEELSGEPPFAGVAGPLSLMLEGRVLVAHNAPFDTDFLDMEYEGTPYPGVTAVAAAVVDTRVIARMLWPDASPSLDPLAMRLGVDRGARDHRHDALLDALLLGRCLPGIVAAIETRLGIRNECQEDAGNDAGEPVHRR